MNESGKHISNLGEREFSPEERVARELAMQKFFDPTKPIKQDLIEATGSSERLIRVFDIVKGVNGQPQIESEYFEKPIRLHKWLNENIKSLDKSQIIALIKAMADAVIILGKFNIIHRDIKPDNFFITDINNIIGSLKLGDFEIVQTVNQPQDDSGDRPLGTAQYASPQQRSLESLADRRMDQYSLAISFIFMLTGGEKDPENYSLSEEAATDAYSTIASKYGSKVADVIKKATDYYQKPRYENTTRFRDELVAALSN